MYVADKTINWLIIEKKKSDDEINVHTREIGEEGLSAPVSPVVKYNSEYVSVWGWSR